MSKQYYLNEVFYSIQGEGGRAGHASIFVRFSGCNLQCKVGTEVGGFDCDTEFASGTKMAAIELENHIEELLEGHYESGQQWIVWTGGEPTLQLDAELIKHFKKLGYKQAIETNGTRPVPEGLDWVCVSPKTAEHTIVVERADEVKYVRHYGQGIPKPKCQSRLKYVSPAFSADGWGPDTMKSLKWCIGLVKQYPDWHLSVQQHKLWGVR